LLLKLILKLLALNQIIIQKIRGIILKKHHETNSPKFEERLSRPRDELSYILAKDISEYFIRKNIDLEVFIKDLDEGSKLTITLPIGYNSYIDKMIDHQKIKFYKQYYFKKINEKNKWKQVSWHEISNCKYGYPTKYSAYGLLIGLEYKN